MAWWVREQEIIEGVVNNHRNPCYLNEADLDSGRLLVTDDLARVLAESDDVFVVVPAAFVAAAFDGITPEMLEGKRLHSGVKGLLPDGCQTVTEFLHGRFGVPEEAMSVFVGPSHAEEAAKRKLTYLTVASSDRETAECARRLLSCQYIRTTYSADMRGLEYSAVMKNVYAIAVGIGHGLGYGDNLTAVLVSNAIKECGMFLEHLMPETSAAERNLMDFAYLGDLLVTSYSQFSRNRTFGSMIGRGYSVRSAQMEMNMVAEGYYAARSVAAIAERLQVELPIAQTVYAILYENASPTRVMRRLMEDLK